MSAALPNRQMRAEGGPRSVLGSGPAGILCAANAAMPTSAAITCLGVCWVCIQCSNVHYRRDNLPWRLLGAGNNGISCAGAAAIAKLPMLTKLNIGRNMIGKEGDERPFDVP